MLKQAKIGLFVATGLLFILNKSAKSQENKGVKFEYAQSWEQIKEKAKAENKYIFVDFYATWCVPCKAMDEGVYKDAIIGRKLNANFICIKIKMDPTTNERQSLTSLYKKVDQIKKKFNINSMPAFLFFAPNGEALSKDIGYKDSLTIVKMIDNALNPVTHYYPIIDSYHNGSLEIKKYPELALRAKLLEDSQLSNRISRDYIEKYLLKSPDSVIFTQSNLLFIKKFFVNTESTAFKFYQNNIEKINKTLGKNAAQIAIRRAITTAYVPAEETWEKNRPNWNLIEKIIGKKGGLLGSEVINGNKMIYYNSIKDWKRFGEAYCKYFQTALQRPEYNINNISFAVFQNIDDQKILRFACDVVMKHAMEVWYQNDAPAYDTYANLLYKTKRVSEAIEWEERAVKLGKDTPDEKELVDNLNRMKNGLPTWIVSDNGGKS